MNDKPFSFEEFSPSPAAEPAVTAAEPTAAAEVEEVDTMPAELEVQKAVVEELAADKAVMESQFAEARSQLAKFGEELTETREALTKAQGEVAALRRQLADQEQQLATRFTEAYEQETRNPNALALLDREVELPDRFAGETRDHVLEVIREARDEAERTGRLRRAQVLESVLVANEPCGQLAARREELKRIFAENLNVVNGVMIEKLTALGIAYKNGEEYLSADEILRRTY